MIFWSIEPSTSSEYSMTSITLVELQKNPVTRTFSEGRMAQRDSRTVPNRALMRERDIADFRLGGFHAEGSRAARRLRAMFPQGELTRRSLYSFASLVGALGGVTLPRDFTRRKELLVKWFDDNFDALEPYLGFFRLDAFE
jgi:hypothetical protein